MSDIRELLHDAAEPPSELDLDRVQRDGRRRQRRPVKIAGAVVAVVVIATLVTLRVADDDQHTARVIAPPPTEAPVQTTVVPATTTPVPATTTPPTPTTLAQKDNGLSTEFRFGYDGLGPIKLGMTLDEASTAGGARIAMVGPSSCSPLGAAHVEGDPLDNLNGGGFLGFGVEDGRIVNIWTTNRNYRTISGIHVGSTEEELLRTYPNAVIGTGIQGNPMITITNAQGRVVAFWEDKPGGTVGYIMTTLSLDKLGFGGC